MSGLYANVQKIIKYKCLLIVCVVKPVLVSAIKTQHILLVVAYI